jgi:hypothetical protein
LFLVLHRHRRDAFPSTGCPHLAQTVVSVINEGTRRRRLRLPGRADRSPAKPAEHAGDRASDRRTAYALAITTSTGRPSTTAGRSRRCQCGARPGRPVSAWDDLDLRERRRRAAHARHPPQHGSERAIPVRAALHGRLGPHHRRRRHQSGNRRGRLPRRRGRRPDRCTGSISTTRRVRTRRSRPVPWGRCWSRWTQRERAPPHANVPSSSARLTT